MSLRDSRHDVQRRRPAGSALSVGHGTLADMTGDLYFNRDGQSIDLATYVRLHSDPEYRFLRRERVGRFEVVTAWLGADQSLGDDPSPAIFGTVALVDGGDELFEDREWWAPDEAEAMANHERLVARLRG